MSEGEGPQQTVLEWFQQHSKEGKTKFYMKDGRPTWMCSTSVIFRRPYRTALKPGH